MTPDLLMPVALMVLGFVLLGVEVVILPGFGVSGVLGVVSLGAGSWLLWEAGGPVLGLVGIAVSLAATVGVVWWFAHSRGGRSLVLADEVGGTSDDDDPAALPRADLVGRTGRVTSPLRPSGVVEVDGERHDAFLRHGAWLEAGGTVRVVGRGHGQLLVEEHTDEES
ncbi:MAG: NfeD family protein [Myxococcota bacterium]